MKFKPNRIIKYLVLSDLLFWAGWGLITPIFSIFIIEKIDGGTIFVAGMAAAVYWILRSAFRIPIGIFLDRHPAERDDYLFLTAGLFIAALTPLAFIFAKVPWHIYVIQAVHALAMAISLSGWSAIFTRHIDKGKEATEWGLDATSVGVGMGISGALGGWAATQFGFQVVFASVSSLGLVSVFLLLCLKNDIKGVFDNGLDMDFKEIFEKEKEE
ncbi:MFS transporter [Candidatus Parcubacteria bacterium]|nr:MFS transporter [Candidatus Parcubacteria bacterium]